jgi:hypothetical protein
MGVKQMSQDKFPTFTRTVSRLVEITPKAFIMLLALAVMIGGVWTYYNIKWSVELNRELKQWQQQGLPLTMAEVIPEKVPDAENAAPIYMQVFNVSFDPGKQPQTKMNLAGLTDAEETLIEEYVSRKDRTKVMRVRALLSRPEVKQTLQVLRLASLRKKAVFPVEWENGFLAPLPHLQRFRVGVRLVAANALLFAVDGQVDEALDWCVVGLRMASHVESEPTLIAQLVTIAMRQMILDAVEEIIAPRSVPTNAGRHLLEELQAIDLQGPYVEAVKSEAAFGRYAFMQIRSKPDWLAEVMPTGLPGAVAAWSLYCSWLGGPLRSHDEAAYLGIMRRQVEATTRPWVEAQGSYEAIDSQILRAGPMPFLTRALTPVFSRIVCRKDIAEARVDLGRIALMLKSYKQQHGQYPESLDELAQSQNTEMPTDPFSGKAYLYTRQGEGFMAYSIGSDGDDDDGAEPEKKNAVEADGDIVWRATR